jgi:hypothetical protein
LILSECDTDAALGRPVGGAGAPLAGHRNVLHSAERQHHVWAALALALVGQGILPEFAITVLQITLRLSQPLPVRFSEHPVRLAAK